MRGLAGALLVAALGFTGALVSTLYLYRAAETTLDRLLEEHLRGAGESAALLLGGASGRPGRLQALQRANDLDAVYVVDRSYRMIADAAGRAGQRADLLRLDADALQRAFAGASVAGAGYALGELDVSTAYFPIRNAAGEVTAVLVLEAGRPFAAALAQLSRARAAALALCLLGALALGLVAARFLAVEQERREQAARAVRGDTLAKTVAMMAHEIRNPLSVIRGTVESMRERAAPPDSQPWTDEAYSDVLGEVERLRGLTEDFLALSSPERPIVGRRLALEPLLSDAARATEAAFRDVHVRCDFDSPPAIDGDAARLRQVFANLLTNAAQAQERGEIELSACAQDGRACVRVRDRGPGLPDSVRSRLFEPFLTTRPGGTGLGLVIARMLVERHGGALRLLAQDGPGTAFEVTLPRAMEEG